MNFYFVDSEYIVFLQNYEKSIRGVTKIPNVVYGDHNKFSFGAVFNIHDLKFYVPVSSYKRQHDANILIRFPENDYPIKGSLRFNYMFPVPDECLTLLNINLIENLSYRMFVQKEYRFCVENTNRILKKAEGIYCKIVSGTDPLLCANSCDFKVLEDGCKLYISEHFNV